MNSKSTIHEFLESLEKAVEKETFVKLTLSKNGSSDKSLKNIYVREILLKNKTHLSFTYHFVDRDETKNFELKKALTELYNFFGSVFLNGDLFTTEKNILVRYNKKRQATLLSKAAENTKQANVGHDRKKKRLIVPEGADYLYELGITDKGGNVLAKGQKKYKQINKYIEIISNLLESKPLPEDARIVDMGSGKGYLTFALYDFLKKQKGLNPKVTGIELREQLVQKTKAIAKKIGAKGLEFISQDINEYKADRIDMLIALHACDIATDLAIAKGIKSKAEIIIVAPCCHKQIRQEMSCETALKPILKHGILKERQAEMITDGIRALLMSSQGYQTKVFEFISTEHTAKNLMIIGVKGKVEKDAIEKVEAIKKEFGIKTHYLEKLL